MTMDTSAAITKLEQAAADGKVTDGAVQNIKNWLTQSRYAQYAAEVARHIEEDQWQALDDAFWTIIPFGTGGRRGRMYPIGSNAINDRTIGESAQGLATYVKENREGTGPLSCAIAYDTRHGSPEFARLCAEIMVANGFTVYFLDQYRSTPELSFMVRFKKCCCGIMVTASHNPPSDNAVKAYWSTGGQILPPHDKGVIDCVMNTDAILRTDFDQAVADGKVVLCKDEVDAAFLAAVKQQQFAGPRDVKIIYSPLHGVGATAVCPALEADRFQNVEVYADHATPDGDFPNVPKHVANPENAAVFDAIIERAKSVGADVILATDPDCDRLGCAAPVTSDTAGEWKTFNGNQIGVLLADYILQQRQAAGTLSPDHYVVKTLVTTDMIRRVADSYGVKTFGNLLVGFKWIGGTMDEQGPDRFVFGTEESHGYLVGQYARDKDGAVASMLMSELAASCKAAGQSLHERLDALYLQHGYHEERLVTQTMPGSEGMTRMKALMQKFRTDPPKTLAGIEVAQVRDYLHQTVTPAGGPSEPLDGPKGDLVIFDLAETGNYVAARPSGTEPKVKFYMFTRVAPEQNSNLSSTKQQMDQRLKQLATDLEAFAETV
ncbi:MAG: phospho-sugar mutase [Planctomycetales bacterium]|nr:phospho-sugar mutase [Planctomycetales bacterium]